MKITFFCGLVPFHGVISAWIIHQTQQQQHFSSTLRLTMEKDNAQQDDSPSEPAAEEEAKAVTTGASSAEAASSVDPSTGSSSSNPPAPPLTKSGLKKMRRLERMMDKRKEKKERKKQLRREKAMALGRDLEQERQENEARAAIGEGRRIREANWEAKMLKCKHLNDFQVAIDCAYEDQMTYKEINSLAQQLRYCYASNKKSPRPCLLAATSVGEQHGGTTTTTTTTTLQLLQKVSGYENWGKRAFTITSHSLEEYYPSRLADIVYLTSDAETVLHTLENNKIYIIGGIVDRNRLKKAAYTRAQVLGVATAKLPLDDNMQMLGATPILTCNHVFDILLHYKEHQDWQAALLSVLPPRKGAKPVAVAVPPPAAPAAWENNSNASSSSPKVAAVGSSSSEVDGTNGLPMENEAKEKER
jgi:tRNA (guanine9-N1)-methyltransferase